MVKSITILLGSIVTAMLALQVAANTASEIHYWEVGDAAPAKVMWLGVLAVGLLLGGTILMLQNPKVASAAYTLSLPLMTAYELEYNRNYLSIPMDRSVAWWMGSGILILVAMAWFSDADQTSTP